MLPSSPMSQEQAAQPLHEDITYQDYSAVRHLTDHIPHPIKAIGNFLDELSMASGNMAPLQPGPQQVQAEAEVAKPDFTALQRQEAALARLEALQAKARNPLSRLMTGKLVKAQRAFTFQEHSEASEQAHQQQR